MSSVKNAFLLENASHHLSSLRAGTFLLVAVLAPMVVAAEAGGLWQFPKTRRQPSFLHQQTFLSRTISLQQDVLFDGISPTGEPPSKLGSTLSTWCSFISCIYVMF